MLDELAEKVRECYRRAGDAATAAREQADLKLREDFFVLERRWLMLARRYEYEASEA